MDERIERILNEARQAISDADSTWRVNVTMSLQTGLIMPFSIVSRHCSKAKVTMLQGYF